MAVVLYLDVGNSACKWRLLGAGAPLQGVLYHRDGRHQGDEFAWVAELATGLAVELETALPALGTAVRPEQIQVASVAGAERNAHLAAALTSVWGIAPHFYYSERSTLGVNNAYAEPARLGVDRWLGVVEAHARYGASLVIDAGSALTIDAVTATGEHLGGYIVPGLTLMRESLLKGTADVRVGAFAWGAQTPTAQIAGAPPADALVWDELAPGINTDAAVDRGVMRMTLAFITDAVVALGGQLADTCTTVITGGDAPLLMARLNITTHHHADLVLDGLQRVTGTASEE